MKKTLLFISSLIIGAGAGLFAQTTVTFNYTGSLQTFTVPPCVNSITITTKGAQGATANDRLNTAGVGGQGGTATGTLAVTPGQILNIYVGGQGNVSGAGGYNGGGTAGTGTAGSSCVGGPAGGGGGASDVRYPGTTFADIKILGGGGGGSGRDYCNGTCQPCGCGGGNGGGGGATGVAGGSAYNCGFGYAGSGINGAPGGTQVAGGAGGAGDGGGPVGTAGGQLLGGTGAPGSYDVAGGGGGGGYYGGGGGGSASSGSGVGGGGGGGGSSYTGGVTSGATTSANNAGNGVVTITYSPGIPSPAGAITGSTSVCANSTGTYSITPVSGATSYTWTVPAGATINSGQGTNSINVTFGSTSGNITVTPTNSCGSSAMATLAITVNPAPIVTASSTASAVCSGGSVTLNGGGATSYAWSGGVTNNVSFNPVSTLTYTVTGTSAGCTGTATITVTVNALPTVTANSTSTAVCFGSAVTLTGGGATTYAWSGGVLDGISFSPAATSSYTVTGTDGNGCMNTATTSVTVNALPTVTANSTATAVCAGSNVTLTGGGASNYTWTGGVLDAVSFVPTSTNTYTVTGTDGNGCVNTNTITVVVNALPVVALGSDITQCGGSVTFDAGNIGSTYLWSDASTTQMITVTTSGTYVVNVTDVNGCMGADTVMATINAQPIVNLGADVVQCGGSVIVDAGNVGSTYSWSNASTTQMITVTSSGTYVVNVTDPSGCMDADTITITINSNPIVDLGNDLTLCGGVDTLDAGNAGSTYLWNDASTNQTLVVTATGTYYCTVTNGNGCTGSDTVMITINALPVVTGTASSTSVCVNDAVVSLTGTPAGGTWTGPGVTGNSFNPFTAGVGNQTVIYTYTDANGCTDFATVDINVSACVGVVETTLSSGVNVFPNPNAGVFTLTVNANVGDLTITITDVQGRVVYSSLENNVNAGYSKQINLDNVASGFYLMKLNTADDQKIERISIQR